jgi:hypothetical protein
LPATKKAPQEPSKPPQGPTKAHLLTATTAVTVVLFILLVVLAHVLKDAGLLSMFRYIVFLACGLVFAQVVFFFKKESEAEVKYKTKNVVIKLGGQAAMAALVVAGTYWLVKDDSPPLPQGIFGYVVHGTDLEEPVRKAKLIIYGGPETQTSDSGAFSIDKIVVRNQPQTAGDPVTFNVSNWVIFDPYVGERGRMYLPKPSTEPIKLRVLKLGDPAFLSGSSIEKILGHKTFIFETTRRSNVPHARAGLPQATAREWTVFLDARAKEIGFRSDQLKAAVSAWTQKWTVGQETDYRKGLAALYHNDLSAARGYLSSALSKSEGDVQVTVAAAYTEYQLGNYAESARLLGPLKKDPVLNEDLTIVEDPANQTNLQEPDDQPAPNNQDNKTATPPRIAPPHFPSTEELSRGALDQQTRNTIRSIVAGNFKAVTDTYTQGLATYVSTRRQMAPPDALRSTWQGLIDRLGPFERIEDVQVELNRNPVVALVICGFQNGKANIEVVFEPREPILSPRICNLYLQPAPGRVWPPQSASNCL